MSSQVALVVHHDLKILQKICGIVSRAGFMVVSDSSSDSALDRMKEGSFSMPDVLVAELADERRQGASLVGYLRANPLTENLPVVLLASSGEQAEEERQRALSIGITHWILPPYDEQEVVDGLRSALGAEPEQRPLSGSLKQLSFPDLVQTLEVHHKTGVLNFTNGQHTGALWFRQGEVVHAATGDGLRGREAFFALSLWDRGVFEASFSSISVSESINDRTSFLLMEAMRRKDEAKRRAEAPPHAALPDPPPPPPPELLALHRALTLLNVAASYASDHVESKLLERRLESVRASLAQEHPVLEGFQVRPGGRVVVEEGKSPPEPEALVLAVALWLRRLFVRLERGLPGRFDLQRLKSVTGAVHDDLESLGFYAALGLPASSEESEG
jgi:CheY-like chemotaxis protein